ncbi:MAG: hypothetical protein QHH07_08935 [Sedimentisphaerales bacterium]|nr:hypothetical protein [Sedimentisphaerales bacterium]
MRRLAGVLGSLVIIYLALGLAGCRQKARSGAVPTWAVQKDYERGPLAGTIRLDKDHIDISQTIMLELEARFPSKYKVRMPRIDPMLEQWILVDWDGQPERLGDDGRLVNTYRYRLEALVSGSYDVPALEFQFVDVNEPNQVYTVQTEPIQVVVTGLSPQDRQNLTIEDIAPVIEPKARRSIVIVAVLLPLIAVTAIGVWWSLRLCRRTAVKPVLKPAHQIAYERLQRLVDRNLIDAGMVKEFYEALSHILRHYIEDRFSIHAPEQTTEEFLHNLRKADLLAVSDRDELGQFLNHCDLVKFARYDPSTDQIQRAFDLAKAFIEKTKSDQHLVQVTETERW